MSHNTVIQSGRVARPVNVFWESLVAAAVLLVGVPPLIGGGVFFLAGLSAVVGGGQQPGPLSWVAIWALGTGGTLLVGITITTSRLYAGRAQPHHREYRDFTLMRHARHGPLLCPKRTCVDGVEVVSFGLHYLLSARLVPAWWPVYQPKADEDIATYHHPVLLCVLPCRVPSLNLWSKTWRWDANFTERIIRGQRRDVSPEFDGQFDLFGGRDAAALFTDKGLQRLLLDNASWSIELRGDRLLAYQVPARQSNEMSTSRTALVDSQDIRFVAELARRIQRAHTRREETGR